jgi:TolA-binding protein
MSGLEQRVTNLEEQVGGIRESVAIIQNEQKHTVSALERIEDRLDEMKQGSLLGLSGALRNPQTIIIILTILGGLLGNNAMVAMADTLADANATEAIDIGD